MIKAQLQLNGSKVTVTIIQFQNKAQSYSLVGDWKPTSPLHMYFPSHVESEGRESIHQNDSVNPPLGQVPWQQNRWL